MSNIKDLDEQRPHSTTSITCQQCGHGWVAVYITGTKALECPGCHVMVNEFGVEVLVNRCADCGSEYTVVPKPDNTESWQSCLSVDCPSYDPDRDVDHLFDGGDSGVVRKTEKRDEPDAYAVVAPNSEINYIVSCKGQIDAEHARQLCHDHLSDLAGHGVFNVGKWVVRPIRIMECDL